MAVAVLWWFLRKFRATLIVASAIPLSLFVAFSVMDGSGRTLNIISLAGLAFAVGMVLDSGIVVLENIMRLRERGQPPAEAAERGALQVWGALLASTATTVAIFLPVVFLKEEIGQLFGDLALAIAVAIVAALVIAVTVVPTAASLFIHGKKIEDPHRHWWDWGANHIMTATDTSPRRWAWIVSIGFGCAALIYVLLPQPSYLPDGNRNLVFAFINPPPGSSVQHLEKEMGEIVAKELAPYVSGEKEPRIHHYFFVAIPRGVFLGARTSDPDKVKQFVGVLNNVLQQFPDTIGFAFQPSLFGSFSGGNAVEVDIQSRDTTALYQAGALGFGLVQKVFPGARIRPLPDLQQANPELKLIPDEQRVAEAGWDRGIMSAVVRSLGDGLFVGEYFDGEKKRDIILRAQPWRTPEELAAIPLATPNSGVVPVGELVQLTRTAGPSEIRRVNRRRTLTLQVTPPENLALAQVIEKLRAEVGPAVTHALPEDGVVNFSGSADKLDVAIDTMLGTFLLAVVILYLLMSALFRSFLDSLLVIAVLPLATVGGIALVDLLMLFAGQALDVLTMIGFIILLGLVVRLRLRPNLMSTLTTLFGMLPLVLIPGAGTELYRGLAAAIVGGLAVSTLFTLILLPSLLRLGENRQTGVMASA